MANIVNTGASISTQTESDTAYIQARHLNIGYNNEMVVGDINFDLSQGEAFALIGTNGSGKSTLLKTIVALL